MATTNKLFIGIDEDKIELTGTEKEAFLEQRTKEQKELKLKIKEEQAQLELKISAYKKLGLTDDEIAAIL